MTVNNGVVYFNISPVMLIVSTIVSYIIIETINRLLERKENKNFVCDVVIAIGGKEIKVRSKIDTGNSLKEPFSNLPLKPRYIIVISRVLFCLFLC